MNQTLGLSGLAIIGALLVGCGEDACQQAVRKLNECRQQCTTCTTKDPVSFSGACNDQAAGPSGGTFPMLSRSRLYNECSVGRSTCTCTIPVGYPFD